MPPDQVKANPKPSSKESVLNLRQSVDNPPPKPPRRRISAVLISVARLMKQVSPVVRHYLALGVLWLVFAACVRISNWDAAPAWLLGLTSNWQQMAILVYIIALVLVSFYQARAPTPRLCWLWLGIFITALSFAFIASVFQGPMYDPVIDRDESATPFITLGCGFLAVGVATFPSSYILWRKYCKAGGLPNSETPTGSKKVARG